VWVVGRKRRKWVVFGRKHGKIGDFAWLFLVIFVEGKGLVGFVSDFRVGTV
jgi:hypothetical protein